MNIGDIQKGAMDSSRGAMRTNGGTAPMSMTSMTGRNSAEIKMKPIGSKNRKTSMENLGAWLGWHQYPIADSLQLPHSTNHFPNSMFVHLYGR
jgi:hypothetical protein